MQFSHVVLIIISIGIHVPEEEAAYLKIRLNCPNRQRGVAERQTSSSFINARPSPSCMGNKCKKKPNIYKLRFQKEMAISDQEIRKRMRWDMPILSDNHKCAVSLDLPILNCIPTSACAEVCYASQGRQFYRRSVIKSLAVNRMIAKDPQHVASKMVDEAAGRKIRIAGSGDVLPEHKALLDYVERYGDTWWGFTKRVDTHRVLPKLVFSTDSTTVSSVLQYVRDDVPIQQRAYLRRPGDPPPPLEVTVTFPVHGPWTNYVKKVPRHKTDCPAVRGEVQGCWRCGRCY